MGPQTGNVCELVSSGLAVAVLEEQQWSAWRAVHWVTQLWGAQSPGGVGSKTLLLGTSCAHRACHGVIPHCASYMQITVKMIFITQRCLEM